MTELSDLKHKCAVIYIGTRKLVGVLADLRDVNPRVLHKQEAVFPEGFEKGLVCNLQNAAVTLEKLLDALLPAEAWEHVPVYVVLGNSRFRMCRASSCEYYTPEKRTISPEEIKSVVQQTRNIAMLPLTEAILQAVPESFLVNDMPSVKNPVGLEAERLGVTLQIFTMEFQSYRNIVKVFESIDIEPEGFFPKTMMLSESALTDSDKQEGALIIDVADEVTQFILWRNGSLAGVKSIPFGGSYLTRRLAADYRIEERDADKVKAKFATLDDRDRLSDELVPLVMRNEKVQQSVRRSEFLDRFFAHAKEWMTKIMEESGKFANDESVRHPHMVFTGGSVMIDGFLEWMQKEFGIEARLGIARQVEASQEIVRDPSLAPVLGMLRWVITSRRENETLFVSRSILSRGISALRQWFANYF
ncbi:MAG: Cell division protein FtsA [Candidatus Omnitrophica bacterium ADurb.Bin277]|nr:MAG: Cell division protein FtsA [Candidatus Omnitrophica bacterium ADurb.Bin277]